MLESGIASINDIWPIPDDSENEGVGTGEILTAKATYFDHQAKLSKIQWPLLVLHAAGDQLVPKSHAERLYQWGGGTQKRLTILPNGNHNTIFTANLPSYVAELERFVQGICIGMPERRLTTHEK